MWRNIKKYALFCDFRIMVNTRPCQGLDASSILTSRSKVFNYIKTETATYIQILFEMELKDCLDIFKKF